jgi:uncharacterized protein YhaN
VKIIALEIDGYGVWSGLKIEGLADGVNVLYGPNEAGKTTLLQFVRAVLYGLSPQRRRYLPPLHGGRPGGAIELATAHGQFQVARHDNDGDSADASGEQLLLTAADGTRQGEHFLKVLLSNVDEAIFNNVFAVGLREMQELGTLGDTEAAAMLYNLTAGLDRVSLVEVMHELETSRNRILDRDGKPCQVAQLMADREKLRTEIEELATIGRRYGHLVAERNQFQREAVRLEEERNGTEQRARVVELAIALGERWRQRRGIDDQLAALGKPCTMPVAAVERFDAVQARIGKHQKRLEKLNQQRDAARGEAKGLKINQPLWRQAARIEALQEQQPWLTNLQNQIAALEKEIAQLETDLAAQQQRLGLGQPARPGEFPQLSPRALAKLHTPGRALRSNRQHVEEARQAVAAAGETAETLGKQIDAALAGRNDRDLSALMDRAGNLVAQLRRRLQADERLGQVTRYQGELEEQSRQLLQRQLLPVWVLASLGGVFALGVMLVLSRLLLSTVTGPFGWALSVLGLAGTGAAALTKITLERSNDRQLEACQKQLAMLQLQVQQAQQERDTLDQQLPRGGGPLAGRLEAAEKELAALEELVPLDARRNAARQDAEAARRRLAQAEEESTAARRRWRDALAAAGLPGTLLPKQVRQLVRCCDEIGQMLRRLSHRREEWEQRTGELDRLVSRIAQVAADAGVPLESDQPAEQLQHLTEAASREQTTMGRREELRRQWRQIDRQQARHKEAISRLKHRRRALLFEAGAEDEQDFRQRALNAARAEVLLGEHATLDREIAAALAGQCPEEAVRELVEGPASERLEGLRDELRQRLQSLQKELQERFERRGQLNEQLKALAADRQLAFKQLEFAAIEKRLEEAIHRWQVLAVTCRTLELIRTTYERDRQPETLQEASLYLERMTQGRYRRVWTPLGENVLRVDDAEGHAIPVEVLSRGTREQLFLSLRLALAAFYSRHGAPLPLVLDDVLVNFDATRAKAAAAVLGDFAAAGHQVLVFTCHEHILRLFQSLKVPVGQLPDNAEAEHASVCLQAPVAKPPKQSRRSAAAPRKSATKAKPADEDEEVAPLEEEADFSEAEEDETEEDTDDADIDLFATEKFVKEKEKKTRGKKRPRRSPRRGAFDADYYDPNSDEEKEDAFAEDDDDEDKDEEADLDADYDDDEG